MIQGGSLKKRDTLYVNLKLILKEEELERKVPSRYVKLLRQR